MIHPDHARFGRLCLGFLLALLVVVLVGVHAGTNDRQTEVPGHRFWRASSPVAVAVHDGKARFRAPVAETGSDLLVVVSSLATAPGPYPISLGATDALDAAIPDQAYSYPARPPKLSAFTAAPIKKPVAGLPPPRRSFSLMVRDGDVANASNYLSVQGVLRAVGQRVQVYVASEDVNLVEAELLKDLVATFDDRIFPMAAGTVGLARDVDGDGRFTVLLSSWLSRLGSGRNAVDGFVRVSDLDLAYSAPFGNRCDMMYLSTNLKPGPHLRTVLTHEYMHAVVFSGKYAQTPGVRPVVVEEEGWLDEALAHLAEDQQGFSRSNIDYRISAFLSQPERYQLVVEDYYAANLFRSHGNRGSTYLFLRWCVDQYGPDLMPALIHSRLRGTANLEAATGCSFADLFRRWSVALFMSGLEPESKPKARGGYRSVAIRNPLEDWELAGPRATSVVAGGPADCWSAAGTSSHFVVVRGGSSAAVEVTVSGPPDAQLQVTAVPLPAGMARLELSAKATTAADGDLRLRATIRESNNEPVRLTALAWEPLTPPADSQVQEFRHGQLDMLGIASTFGTSALAGGAALRSREIRLKGVHPGTGPLIVKLVGTDDKGRRVAAWRVIDNLDPESEAGLLPPFGETIH